MVSVGVRVLFAFALVVSLCAVLSAAQTTVYFVAQTTGTYPSVCTTGSLSCSTNSTSGGYACSGGTLSGTHYYYPAASAPTFVSTLVTGTTPTLCEQYYADFQLPLTTAGLNVQYGSSSQPVCVNYRIRNATTGALTGDPDAVDTTISFSYNTTASALPNCTAPTAASSSSAATVYFTYLGLSGTNAAASTICGAGSLSCTSYGTVGGVAYYSCPSLISGTHYQYSSTSSSFQTIGLSGETECNGFGDGYLPLDYEGISFGGAFGSGFGCISWYGYSAGTKQGYQFYTAGTLNNYTNYGGTQSFTYGTTATTPAAACSSYIPGLSANNTGAAATTAHFSAITILATTALAALALLMVML